METSQAEEGLTVIEEALDASRNTGMYHYDAELFRLKGKWWLNRLMISGEVCGLGVSYSPGSGGLLQAGGGNRHSSDGDFPGAQRRHGSCPALADAKPESRSEASSQ